ncbi:MAG: hypothetical protein QOI95_2457 [Acidimicrobiaceae bacterium]|jgi:hypothetical protein
MVKRVLLGFAALSLAGLFVFVDAAPAPAVVSSGCQGTGDFEKSGHHYTAADAGVDEVPLEDTVHWQGSIDTAATEQAYSGSIEVQLPWPLPAMQIDSWKGSSDSTSNKGDKHYKLPSSVPRNVEFEVTGKHTQGITCTGHVTVVVAGSAFDSPAAPASLIGTVLTGGVLALAGRVKGGGVA